MSIGAAPDNHDAVTRRLPANRERPDYYVTPTHDFTQYTQDYEEKYWSRDAAFDWHQSVPENLRAHLDSLPRDEFSRIANRALPLVDWAAGRSIEQVRHGGLPLDHDALKAIGECVPFDRKAIEQALAIQAPLEQLQHPVARLRDRLAILTRESLELHEQRRLGLFKNGTTVTGPATEIQRLEQLAELAAVSRQIDETRQAVEQAKAVGRIERNQLTAAIRGQLKAIEPAALADLEAARALVRRVLRAGIDSADAGTRAQLEDLVLKRQLRGLKDIANHCVVVEQTAIAPLSVGIIHYKRRREIQEAMTTFVNDEAKHSAVFRRFLADKMAAKEHVPEVLVKGGERYMWLARFLPSAGMFLAVIVEAIGAGYLEFFGIAAHMPDPLFRTICETIAERDEKRHMDLCAATYNELYRTGSRWERLRNQVALRMMMKAGYGDRTEQHPLLQACLAFGLEADALYRHVAGRLSQQLARVGAYVSVAEILAAMNYSQAPRLTPT